MDTEATPVVTAEEMLEFVILQQTLEAFKRLDKSSVERIVGYLKHWNDKRPARDD